MAHSLVRHEAVMMRNICILCPIVEHLWHSRASCNSDTILSHTRSTLPALPGLRRHLCALLCPHNSTARKTSVGPNALPLMTPQLMIENTIDHGNSSKAFHANPKVRMMAPLALFVTPLGIWAPPTRFVVPVGGHLRIMASAD
jgi:hypothetical protein